MSKIIINIFLVSIIAYGNMYSQNLDMLLSPAFQYPSKISIDVINDSCYIKLVIYNNRDTFKIKNSEEKIIAKSKFDNVLNFLIANKSFTNSSVGCDGISVKGTFVYNLNKVDINFWSPEKHTENHELLVAVRKFLLDNLKNKYSKKYLKSLRIHL